jgi:hypothetical protein
MRSIRKPLGTLAMIGTLTALPLATHAQEGAGARPVITPHIERMDPALDALVDAAQPIERVATGFVFTEGPMWVKGRLFFSDVRDDKMYALTPGGEVELLNGHSGVWLSIRPMSMSARTAWRHPPGRSAWWPAWARATSPGWTRPDR